MLSTYYLPTALGLVNVVSGPASNPGFPSMTPVISSLQERGCVLSQNNSRFYWPCPVMVSTAKLCSRSPQPPLTVFSLFMTCIFASSGS